MSVRAKKNHYFNQAIYSKIFLILGFVLFLIIVIALIKGISKGKKVDEEISTLKKEIAELEKSNQDLKHLINYLQSEDFIKQEGKLKFGLREPGERAVVIDSNDPSKKKINLPHEEEKLSNPQKWWRYFFN